MKRSESGRALWSPLDCGELTGDEILALCPNLITDHRLASPQRKAAGKEERQMLRLVGKVRDAGSALAKGVVAHQNAMP